MADQETYSSRGKETFRTDGNAVDVVFTGSTPKDKGTPWVDDGFFGILMSAASSGDTVAMEIQQRVHELVVGSGVTAAKGDILYISAARVITNTGSDTPFMRVVKAKDVNNVIWGLLLPQVA